MIITYLYVLIFFCATYLPVIRFGGIPFLISDFLLPFLLLAALLYARSKRSVTMPKELFWLIIIICYGAFLTLFRWTSIVDIDFKDVALIFIHSKMLAFLVLTFYLWQSINIKKLLKIVMLMMVGQFFVALLQKAGVPFFASGPLYDYAVNNAMNNVYYGGAIDHIIETHLQVTFRPIGFVGSSTILASFLVISFYLWNVDKEKISKKLLMFASLFLTFSKITMVSFFIYICIIEPIKKGVVKINLKKMLGFTLSLAIGAIYVANNERIYSYLDRSMQGDDYGVTHRIDVFNFIANLNLSEWLFGIGGEPPFIFDSGLLLTIFRFGIIYLILVYIGYYYLFKKYSYKNSHLFFIVFFVLADATIGTFHNQMFFYLISYSIIFSRYLAEKNEYIS